MKGDRGKTTVTGACEHVHSSLFSPRLFSGMPGMPGAACSACTAGQRGDRGFPGTSGLAGQKGEPVS